MKTILFSFFLFVNVLSMAAQSTIPAYALFDSNGSKADYQQMIKQLNEADVVFIGEYHNNPISHWMELEVTQALHKSRKGKIIMGAEMFEADCQLILEEYVSGLISTSRFEADCRLWHNYSTDYSPLVEFSREHSIPFIATNIPRRYADIVHHQGESVLDSLGEEAKRYIAPLPIPFKPDSVMLAEGGIMSLMSKNPLGIAKAQAIKDATMAYFIAKHFEKGKLFIHYNGTYHSDNQEGIVYFLQQYAPNLNIKTITTTQQEDISNLEEDYRGIADYILCVPESMTKTY